MRIFSVKGALWAWGGLLFQRSSATVRVALTVPQNRPRARMDNIAIIKHILYQGSRGNFSNYDFFSGAAGLIFH